jgi:general secretion pathway protein N
MPGKKRLITAGLAVLIISVVVTFPAAVAYSWFAPESLKLNGIEGSVWTGHAAEGSVNGIYIGNIQWSMRPLALFTGKVAFSTHSEPASGYLDSNIAVSMLGTVYLSELEGNLSLAAFERSFQLQGFDGQLRLQFDELAIADGIPTYAEGSVVVSQLLAPKLSPTAIGDFRADISTVENGIRGVVEDMSGVLDVAGTLLLSRDRSYSLVGKVAAAPNAPPGLQQQLRYLGSADAAGKRDFRIEGSL